MIVRLLDRFLSWLSEPRWRNVAQADRFAREQAMKNIRHGHTDDEYVAVNCTKELCCVPFYHSPCLYQTAIAAKRDRERRPIKTIGERAK